MNHDPSTLPDDVILYAYGPVFEDPERAIWPDFNKLIAEHPWGTKSMFAGLMPVRSSKAGEWLITFNLGLDYLRADVDHWERDLTVFLEHLNQLAHRAGTFFDVAIYQSSNILQYLTFDPLTGYDFDSAKMVREIHQFATVGVFGPTKADLFEAAVSAHRRSQEEKKRG